MSVSLSDNRPLELVRAAARLPRRPEPGTGLLPPLELPPHFMAGADRTLRSVPDRDDLDDDDLDDDLEADFSRRVRRAPGAPGASLSLSLPLALPRRGGGEPRWCSAAMRRWATDDRDIASNGLEAPAPAAAPAPGDTRFFFFLRLSFPFFRETFGGSNGVTTTRFVALGLPPAWYAGTRKRTERPPLEPVDVDADSWERGVRSRLLGSTKPGGSTTLRYTRRSMRSITDVSACDTFERRKENAMAPGALARMRNQAFHFRRSCCVCALGWARRGPNPKLQLLSVQQLLTRVRLCVWCRMGAQDNRRAFACLQKSKCQLPHRTLCAAADE